MPTTPINAPTDIAMSFKRNRPTNNIVIQINPISNEVEKLSINIIKITGPTYSNTLFKASSLQFRSV